MGLGSVKPAPSSSSPPPCPAIYGGPDSASDGAFKCFLCLDLVYKPIVLPCGHVSCFWCVRELMNKSKTSYCALCRRPYYNFPGICRLLHHILCKAAPGAYKKREEEVLMVERSTGIFAPQLDGPVSECVNSVSVDDVLCGLCNRLLFRPAVLNCGHVYCRSCLPVETSMPIKCHICEGLHPGDLPKVCFELHHFLEERFIREYSARKVEILERVCQQEDSFSSASQTKGDNAEGNGWGARYAHWDVGCDSCGMYPIYGIRYRCEDCKVPGGYDNCEACFNTRSTRPGRFNQLHTSDHNFVIDNSMLLDNLVTERLQRAPVV